MAGGFLGGLSAGFKNMGGSMRDMFMGTTPELRTTQAPDMQDPMFGAIKQMPQIEATGGTTGGLLDKIKTPDARGLTFGDKLFAAGSVLQGDSGGAASYIANQRQAADALGERDRQRKLSEDGIAALRGAIDPLTGQLDFRKYLGALPAGVDPSAAMKFADQGRGSFMNARGGLYYTDPRTGTAREVVAPMDKATRYNPDGTLNEDFMASEEEAAERLAAARRKGAPLAVRSGGGRGGAKRAFTPQATGKSY